MVPFISQAEEELEELVDDGSYVSEYFIEIVRYDDPDTPGVYYVGWMTMSDEGQMVGELVSPATSRLDMVGEFAEDGIIEAYIVNENNTDDRKFRLKVVETIHYNEADPKP